MNCSEYENLMDDYFSHQLDKKTKKQVQEHLKVCSNCQAVFADYEKMLHSLHSLELKTCPDEVVDSVMDILNIETDHRHQLSLVDSVRRYFARYRWRIGLIGAAACVALALIFIYPKNVHPPETEAQYSEADIEQAKDQVKIALAYFNKVTTQTQEILEQKVLPEQVVKPMKSSIKTAIKPFFDGGES